MKLSPASATHTATAAHRPRLTPVSVASRKPSRVVLLALAACAVCDRDAFAQGLDWKPSYDPDHPYQLPDAPAPPTLPDLTHRAVALSIEATVASVQPPADAQGATPDRVGVWIGRLEAEAALSNRRWYLGLAQEIARGQSSQADDATVIGNPEVWGRALWASRAGLAYGGGLGIVPPLVPQEAHDEPAPSPRASVRVVRPWDYPHFAGRVVTFRPFVDVRVIDGRVLLQLRQGVDVVKKVASDDAIPDTTLTSRTMFYMGYRPVDPVGIGLELSEVYFIKAPGVTDEERAVFAVSPSIRWMSPVLQPAISGIFPFDRPLFGAARDYWAIRLTLGMVIDPDPPTSIW